MTAALLASLGVVAGLSVVIVAGVALIGWALWTASGRAVDRALLEAQRNANLSPWYDQLPTFPEAAREDDAP